MLRNLYFVVPVEVLLQPLEDVVAGEVGEDALVEVGAPASAQVTDVVDVHRNLPDSGKSLGRAKIIQFKDWSQSWAILSFGRILQEKNNNRRSTLSLNDKNKF